ncbi:2-oxoglutarate ferredoxin oxidoreductase subunit alpha [mine drainage metagenome]|uniref:2-oxoglutarate ferredoxin oxidoreductase subunit alpha n=1 Tax=mine drainage metagenome TaxID=410659 RepID=A0A1J5QG98_9ZZZZ
MTDILLLGDEAVARGAIDAGISAAFAYSGMHSSQNEQDSRYFADFAMVPCLEPSDQQQCYDFTREAFELSEALQVPVLLRLVTRLAHSRSSVTLSGARGQNEAHFVADPTRFILSSPEAGEAVAPTAIALI